MRIYKALRWVQHIQKFTFSEQNSIQFSNFFWCLILDVMFWDFGASWCQNFWFWEPLGGQKMASKIGQMVPKRVCRAPGVDTSTCFQDRFRSSPGHHLVDFAPPWHQNHIFSYDFSIHVDENFDIISGHRFASSGLNVQISRWFREAFPDRFLIIDIKNHLIHMFWEGASDYKSIWLEIWEGASDYWY